MTSRHKASKVDDRAKVTELIEKLREDVQHIIKVKFPQRIIALTELLDTADFSLEYNINNQKPIDLPVPPPMPAATAGHNCGAECNAPIYFPNGAIAPNSRLVEIFNKLTPLLNETIVDCNRAKLGLQLLVPKVEDGNNTGVEIQDHAIDLLQSLTNKCLGRFGEVATKLENRGNIIAKVVKHPHCLDYRLWLQMFEEDKRTDIAVMANVARSQHSVAYDYFLKNWEKIFYPRGQGQEASRNAMY